MVAENLLNKQIIKLVSSIIINQDYHNCDIYNWYININISNSDKKRIEIKINNSNNLRNTILLKNLINYPQTNIFIKNDKNNKNSKSDKNDKSDKNNKNDKSDKSDKIKKFNNDIFNIESKNIYEEYLYLGLIEEIELYVNDECKNANIKNCFCKNGLEIFFSNNIINKNYDKTAENNKILYLFNHLINKKFLYKSNLSRGLLYLIKENKKKKLDDARLILFLKFLKKNGITKGVEYLMKKYNLL